MAQIESPPHPLDDFIKREDSDDIPMTTFHYAHSQDLPFTLVIDVEICSNFISSDLVNILGLTRWVHPEPYYLGPNYAGLVMSQCKISLKVGQYKAELLCDVTNVETFVSFLVRIGLKVWVFAIIGGGRPSSTHG